MSTVTTLLRSFCRWALQILPDSTVVPILTGHLRGHKWLLHSGVGSYWLGSYEAEEQSLIASVVKPGMVCYDCGANVGFYTLLLSKLVGSSGRVIAFEPLPGNAEFVRRHANLNRCSNVEVYEVALTDRDGCGRLISDRTMSRLDDKGGVGVTCRRLDSLVLPPPDLIKVDIEGTEVEMLHGAESILRTRRPALLVSLHISLERAHECGRWLEDFGYAVTWSDKSYDLYASSEGKTGQVFGTSNG